MPISINDPILSTKIFIAIFALILLATLRRNKNPEFFPPALTRELKGLAILAIVFSHIGYFLSADHRFLFPLSIMAGIGVNLFLFLSGYGLAASALKRELPIAKFYKKRLLKLFAPFWIATIIFFLLDFFSSRASYSWPYIIRSLLGFFPRADLSLDVNSPLWFFTPVLFYYFIFPLIFFKKRPWLTAILIYAISSFILRLNLPVSIDVLHLYQLHLLAFPLGIAFASLFTGPSRLSRFAPVKIKSFLHNLNRPVRYIILTALLILIGFTAYNSGVGENPDREQIISLMTMGAIIIFFILKKFEIKLFYLFGFCAYEIYLIHWPLLSRYDIFFKLFPGWLAMILFLGLFLIIALALKSFLKKLAGLKRQAS
ncbi:MAG: acyltransferase [Patescibacteria group bacterium]|jgi:peptidoglycan/LPS O-acetylase OafA/YrhL